jgi:hypothetical protein
MTYYYFAYGLNIQSEIELPELLPSTNNKVDVEITFGECPITLTNCLKKGVIFEIGANEYLFEIIDVARFYIADGNKIIIEPKGKRDYDDIRLFLLGTCLGAILHQQQILPLHASAIAHNNEAVLFTGRSGSGKSSIATGFRLKGCKMITDDICPIKIIDGKSYALPGYPQTKLCEDTMESFNIDIEQHNLVREGIGKRAIRFQDGFASTPKKIKAIYNLVNVDVDEIQIIPWNNSDKYTLLENNIYRKNIVKGMKLHPQLFNALCNIAAQTPIKMIKKTECHQVKEVIKLIDQDLQF